jgi:hypothetical protein
MRTVTAGATVRVPASLRAALGDAATERRMLQTAQLYAALARSYRG